MRVFIVGSTPAQRERLREQVESGEVRVVGESATVESVGQSAAIDVLLVADDQVLAAWPPDLEPPGRAVVVLAGFDVARVAARLATLDLAGWAVLAPGASGDEVRAAMAAAETGLAVMPLDVASSALSDSPPSTGVARDFSPVSSLPLDDAFDEPLTPREREVLEEMSRGLSNREIAARLGISEHTAKFHVASVLAKLGAANRADAVRRGLRRGWVTL